ncbi:MAG: hypothetical protein ACK502_09510 [Alphaproteobacteria bacterium]
MLSRTRSIRPEALLVASIVSGCATPPPEEYRLSVHTSQANFLQEVYKAAELIAECSRLRRVNGIESQTADSPYNEMPLQLKAVYHYFSWQHHSKREELIKMLHGFHKMQNCPNKTEMNVVIEGLEELDRQITARDAALDERIR